MADEKGIPERRVAFLETCFEVFCKNGLENTGLKMLAEACGVTNGSLLYYFGMLTISGMYEGKTKLTIPNQVVREQIYTYLLSTYDEADLSFSGYEKNELPAPLPTTLTGKPISVILPTA